MLEPVPRCEPSTYQSISRWQRHYAIRTGMNNILKIHKVIQQFKISIVISMGPPHEGSIRRPIAPCSLMVRWVVGSILHGVDPLSYFSFQPVLHDWCNKGRGMCYLVCGMVHIKEPLLLIDKSSLCGDSGFPFSLSEWSLTICLTSYNRR